MLKNFFQKSVVFAIILFSVPVFSLVSPTQAAPDLWGGKQDDVADEMGYDDGAETDPRILAARVITVLLSFLGIIAVALIIYGGFKWMTAGGNDDQVSDAMSIIKTAVIGLVIILGAWALANWVIGTIQTNILE